MNTGSLEKNRKGICLMVLSSIFVCIGQLFWKLSAEQGLLYLLTGFFLYGVGALVMIIAYRFGSLSVLQPILSINYIFSLLIGHFILSESISLVNIIGIGVIIGGVVLIATGD